MATTVVSVNIKGLDKAARLFGLPGQQAVDRAARSAVSFTARDYVKKKYQRIRKDVDRPAPFTRNPLIYNWDGAKPFGAIQSRAYVNTTQSEYLLLTETGGLRTKAAARNGKTTRPMRPKKAAQDRYGGIYGNKGIQRKFLSKGAVGSPGPTGRKQYRTGDRRYFVATLNLPGQGSTYGLFERRKTGKKTRSTRAGLGSKSPGWKTRLLVRFLDQARYKPKLNFRSDAVPFVREKLPKTFQRLLRKELRDLGF